MTEWPKACALIYRRRGSEKLENTPIGATKPLMFGEGQTEGRNGLPYLVTLSIKISRREIRSSHN